MGFQTRPQPESTAPFLFDSWGVCPLPSFERVGDIVAVVVGPVCTMDRYHEMKVVGKGTFGFAVLVEDVDTGVSLVREKQNPQCPRHLAPPPARMHGHKHLCRTPPEA